MDTPVQVALVARAVGRYRAAGDMHVIASGQRRGERRSAPPRRRCSLGRLDVRVDQAEAWTRRAISDHADTGGCLCREPPGAGTCVPRLGVQRQAAPWLRHLAPVHPELAFNAQPDVVISSPGSDILVEASAHSIRICWPSSVRSASVRRGRGSVVTVSTRVKVTTESWPGVVLIVIPPPLASTSSTGADEVTVTVPDPLDVLWLAKAVPTTKARAVLKAELGASGGDACCPAPTRSRSRCR